MTYKIITVTAFGGLTSKHILIDNGDDTFVSFPVDDSNPNYIAFIEENPDAVKKVRDA